MENRTNPFYELYDRLYAAAAAGTAVLPEDFRLKRAVEGFEPLAQKNKVFAKLHQMCAGLLTSESEKAPACTNKFVQLADCLALAEALAVTQGSFLDSSETTPAKGSGFTPHDITYSELTSLKEYIAKAKHGSKYIPESLPPVADDPRLVTEFIKYCDSSSENVAEYAKTFAKVCGSALVEPLLESIDMNNPKASGRQIDYIADFTGSELIGRFKQYAFDENAPAGVRIAAINALSRFDECADDLIELYNISKNKVATTALEAIGRISPPQAEPLFEKLAKKYKAAYCKAFSQARYPVCSQLVRERLKEYLEQHPDKGFDNDFEELLRNKNDVYDCFELIIKVGIERCKTSSVYHDLSYYVERTLIKDLLLDEKYFDDYAKMIEQLYRRYPDKMIFTRLILEYRRSGDKAFEILADDLRGNIKELHRFVHMINCDYSTGEYYLGMYYSDMPRISFCDHIPDGLLNVLLSVEPVEKNDPETNCLRIRNLCAVYHCNEEEANKARAAAFKYAQLCDKCYPNKVAVEELMSYGKTLPEGAVVRMLIHTLEKKGKLPTTLYTLGASEQFARQVYNEFQAAVYHIPEMKDKFSQQVIADGVAVIRGAMKLTEDYLKRYNV